MKLDLQFPSKSLFLDFQYKHGYVSHILALLFLKIVSTTGDETNPINYIFSETMAQTVNKPPVSAGDLRDVGSIPGWGRSPGGGNGSLSTLVLSPGESHGQRSLPGYSPWGCKELDTTQLLTLSLSLHETYIIGIP